MWPLYDGRGLRTLYLGDEAIVDVGAFTLEGRPIRKVRQSVSRLRKAGYTAELRTVASWTPDTLPRSRRCSSSAARALPSVASRWRWSRSPAPQRGIRWCCSRATGTGAIRGVLQFVPCYGRPAMSLSFMRRDPATPNGLTEFMVASAVEQLRERGIEEMSLNFAAFAQWMHSPETPVRAGAGALIALGNPYFQIESLYRFNAKFFPRWEPRYLVYEGALGLPRASLAAMWAEGQLPKPSLPERPVTRGAPQRAVAAGGR